MNRYIDESNSQLSLSGYSDDHITSNNRNNDSKYAETYELMNSNDNRLEFDDNQSNSSSNLTERHLKIWNKFFENAMKVSDSKIDNKLDNKIDNKANSRSLYGYSPTKSLNSNKSNDNIYIWPKEIDIDRYNSLINNIIIDRLTNEEAGQLLILASIQSDIKTIERLLINNIIDTNINYADEFNRSSVHYCAKNNNVLGLAILLDYGADIDCIDRYNMTPLHYTCIYANYDSLLFLLESAANCNCIDSNGNNPLHILLINHNVNSIEDIEICCSYLIQYNIDQSHRNKHNLTALDIAQQLPDNSNVINLLTNPKKNKKKLKSITNTRSSVSSHSISHSTNSSKGMKLNDNESINSEASQSGLLDFRPAWLDLTVDTTVGKQIDNNIEILYNDINYEVNDINNTTYEDYNNIYNNTNTYDDTTNHSNDHIPNYENNFTNDYAYDNNNYYEEESVNTTNNYNNYSVDYISNDPSNNYYNQNEDINTQQDYNTITSDNNDYDPSYNNPNSYIRSGTQDYNTVASDVNAYDQSYDDNPNSHIRSDNDNTQDYNTVISYNNAYDQSVNNNHNSYIRSVYDNSYNNTYNDSDYYDHRYNNLSISYDNYTTDNEIKSSTNSYSNSYSTVNTNANRNSKPVDISSYYGSTVNNPVDDMTSIIKESDKNTKYNYDDNSTNMDIDSDNDDEDGESIRPSNKIVSYGLKVADMISDSVWGVTDVLLATVLSMFQSTNSNISNNINNLQDNNIDKHINKSRTNLNTSFTMNQDKPIDPSPTDSNKSTWGSDSAPPTDTELSNLGLGFHKPPKFVVDDINNQLNAMRTGLTPRRNVPIQPPREVQQAVFYAKAEADRIRNTPRTSLNNRDNNVNNPYLLTPSSVTKGYSQYVTIDKNIPGPLFSHNHTNSYSMGNSLPRGVTWRYVDVLNNPDILQKTN